MRSHKLHFEALEDRSLPAVLLNPYTVYFQDTDGDFAQVRINKPLFTEETVNEILHFDTGSVDGSQDIRQQLQLIDLWEWRTQLTNLDISVTLQSTAEHTGNHRVDVGGIAARVWSGPGGQSMGDITVAGDLGYLSVGYNVGDTLAMRRLHVYSLGQRDDSQGGILDHNHHVSQIKEINLAGDVESIEVDEDIVKVSVGHSIYIAPYRAHINSIRVGGSIFSSQFNLGSVDDFYIGGDITVFGTKTNSSELTAIGAERIKRMEIVGSIVTSGLPDCLAGITISYVDLLTVRGQVLTDQSGSISKTYLSFRSAIFHGNVSGGVGGLSWGPNAGIELIVDSLITPVQQFGTLTFKGDMQAAIIVKKNLNRLEVQGTMFSDAMRHASFIQIDPEARVKEIIIRNGIRTAVANEGQDLIASSGRLDSVTVYGDVNLQADLTGEHYLLPRIIANTGTYRFFGNVSNLDFQVSSLLSLEITGNSINCPIFSHGYIGRVTIGGNYTAQTGLRHFGIKAVLSINSIVIHGNVQIEQATSGMNFVAGYVVPGTPPVKANLREFIVRGNFTADSRFDPYDDSRSDVPGIYVSGLSNRISIGGNLVNANIFVTGVSRRNAVNSLTVGGDIVNSVITAGRSLYSETEGHAISSGFGAIRIRGSMVSSVVAAGISAGPDFRFFTEDDQRLSQITSSYGLAVIHSFRVDGTITAETDLDRRYGVMTDWIKHASVAGDRLYLLSGPRNDLILFDALQRVRITERLLGYAY